MKATSLLIFSLCFSSAAYAAKDYSYSFSAGVCFNQYFAQGYNADESQTECRDLSNLSFVSKSFENQNLKGTNFSGTNLLKTNFSGADLRGVNFQDAYLKDSSFKGATVDRFTKTSEYIDWVKEGASISDQGSSSDTEKDFEKLVQRYSIGTSALSEIDLFLTQNPSLNLNDIMESSPGRSTLHQLTLKLLTDSHFDFFNLLVKRGFRFDLDFLRFSKAGYMREPYFLRAALKTKKLDILDYVLRYYSPYNFTRIHLTRVINDLSATSLDRIVKSYPNLLTDSPEKVGIEYPSEDPLYEVQEADVLKRLLELNIPRHADTDYSRKFFFNFIQSLDFQLIDIPLSYGFDFSKASSLIPGLIGIVDKKWDSIQDKKNFLIELKLRTYSASQPRGFKVLDADEAKNICQSIGFLFKMSGGSTEKHIRISTIKYLDVLNTYVSVFGTQKSDSVLRSFLDPGYGGGENYYWKYPEYELAFRTILAMDTAPDLDFALGVLETIRSYDSTAIENPIYQRLLELIKNRKAQK